MSRKLDRVRVLNLLSSLERAVTFTERLSLSDSSELQAVAKEFEDKLSDMSMELGMLLADDEDGTKTL
jgi:hypothetical protein